MRSNNTMETTFYHDDQAMYHSREQMKSLKRTMKLDFNSARPVKKQKQFSNILLSSPDLNMLKLASPELEKLIIQQNGFVTTTPTPTQHIPQILFPKTITEEQENYAKGFVDALEELRNNTSYSEPLLTALTTVGTTAVAPTTTAVTTSAPSSRGGGGGYVPQGAAFVTVKEEPQMVPSMAASPPLSPIDMASQERIKLERKRQRNRIAASKCRRRKLERISRLEDRVRLLKGENSELANVVNKLRETICQLKEEVMDHAKNGCQIMVSRY